jgi:hypothetical protein
MKGACAQFIQHSEKVDEVRVGLKITVSMVNKTMSHRTLPLLLTSSASLGCSLTQQENNNKKKKEEEEEERKRKRS